MVTCASRDITDKLLILALSNNHSTHFTSDLDHKTSFTSLLFLEVHVYLARRVSGYVYVCWSMKYMYLARRVSGHVYVCWSMKYMYLARRVSGHGYVCWSMKYMYLARRVGGHVYVCWSIDFDYGSTIFRFCFGTAMTVWYILFFITN